MELNGYFILGSVQASSNLPLFSKACSGSHVGSKSRGIWVVDSSFDSQIVNLPARDKQVQLWSNTGIFEFANLISSLDSSYLGLSYKEKLNGVRSNLTTEFQGTVNNINSSTHGSLALLCNLNPIYLYGLHDTQLDSSYLMWSTNQDFVYSLMEAQPLRYLLYRFPVLENNAIFIQSEAICSKWWGWLKTHKSHLHAFNALEKRLF